jgi:hypothetical protein
MGTLVNSTAPFINPSRAVSRKGRYMMSARCTGKAGTLRSCASAGADKAGHGVNTSALTSRLAVRPTPAATQGGPHASPSVPSRSLAVLNRSSPSAPSVSGPRHEKSCASKDRPIASCSGGRYRQSLDVHSGLRGRRDAHLFPRLRRSLRQGCRVAPLTARGGACSQGTRQIVT